MGGSLIRDGGIDDEHTRALEEQWIEGDLTHETAQSESSPASLLEPAMSSRTKSEATS